MIILKWLIAAIAVIATSYILPGIYVANFWVALIVALVLGLINSFIKPILLFLALPINVLTFGLFTFVINAALILLADNLVAGFTVDGFLWALIFSLIVSIVNSLLWQAVTDTNQNTKKFV